MLQLGIGGMSQHIIVCVDGGDGENTHNSELHIENLRTLWVLQESKMQFPKGAVLL